MILDKKQIWAIFSFEFKMGHEAARQLATSTTCLSQELLMNLQCSGGSGSFAKEMRALKMRSIAASPQKLTTANWEPLPKLILLQLHKLPKNSTSTILPSLSIWSKLEKWKSSMSTCLMSWLKILKNCCLEVSSLILYSNNEPFLNQVVTCNEKWISFDNQWWTAQ